MTRAAIGLYGNIAERFHNADRWLFHLRLAFFDRLASSLLALGSFSRRTNESPRFSSAVRSVFYDRAWFVRSAGSCAGSFHYTSASLRSRIERLVGTLKSELLLPPGCVRMPLSTAKCNDSVRMVGKPSLTGITEGLPVNRQESERLRTGLPPRGMNCLLTSVIKTGLELGCSPHPLLLCYLDAVCAGGQREPRCVARKRSVDRAGRQGGVGRARLWGMLRVDGQV